MQYRISLPWRNKKCERIDYARICGWHRKATVKILSPLYAKWRHPNGYPIRAPLRHRSVFLRSVCFRMGMIYYAGLLPYTFRRYTSTNAQTSPSLLPITGIPMTCFRNIRPQDAQRLHSVITATKPVTPRFDKTAAYRHILGNFTRFPCSPEQECVSSRCWNTVPVAHFCHKSRS